ncbi:SAM and SH3 domain-containing protein 1-like [Schistocerca cancellata]|uniref:SAM and SH3 domain-containing protein 1-like n=1 Tax=Schistocerca cancellata TaxID=274614 RepID=UPI00211896E4|nr:SAM and SH3 domain-containing protein 1-like [Schistocerca cancellata]
MFFPVSSPPPCVNLLGRKRVPPLCCWGELLFSDHKAQLSLELLPTNWAERRREIRLSRPGEKARRGQPGGAACRLLRAPPPPRGSPQSKGAAALSGSLHVIHTLRLKCRCLAAQGTLILRTYNLVFGNYTSLVSTPTESNQSLRPNPYLNAKPIFSSLLLYNLISNPTGERGYLEGLASRYADLFNTHYGDVLEHLDELRRREWDELSPRMRVLGSGAGAGAAGGTPASTPDSNPSPQQLTTSLSQPIYVPGKYQPSSCLSDKEEDEIYGFGYGVYGRQVLQRQPPAHKVLLSPHVPYQSCLSPRSAYFYEFPPSDANQQQQSGKKKTSFSRFLRGLKTAHRKDKASTPGASGGCSPRHARARQQREQRVGTPDSVVESMLPSIVDPRDYDRLRFMQMNGGAPNSFEETIHRLKVQEVLKKRERFHKEHEEILRDIKQGLKQLGREGGRPIMASDDTYMYDDDARCSGLGPHWYDEPPYESDPEDFLMGGQPVPTATIQNGRVCFTLNLRQQPHGEGVISLRSAGDISVPRETGSSSWARAQTIGGVQRTSARRGLLVPPSGPIITSSHRESGDYAGSDVQSIGSRLSTMSIETSRSEQTENPTNISSPSYISHMTMGKGRHFRKTMGYTSRSSASEEGLSPSQSSDYEDQEELQSVQQVTVHATESGCRAGVTLSTRSKGLRQDVQKKGSRLRSAAADGTEKAFPSTSSVESLPSGSGSSTQALVPASSNHSSISAEDCDTSIIGPVIGRARALVDYTPSPYDKDALKFKKGDIIDIVTMNPSGLWKGILHNKVGTFKFINVEVLTEKGRSSKRHHSSGKYSHHCVSAKGKPHSVEDLLRRINLEEHISVFVLNGYEDLELFKDLEGEDLDYLGINNPEHRAKILTAVELLHDYDSPESPVDTDEEDQNSSTEDDAGSISQHSECSTSQFSSNSKCSSFQRLQFPRDSGCYDASMKERMHSHHKHHHHRKGHSGTVMQHHHHHSHHSQKCEQDCSSQVDCTGSRVRDCGLNLRHCSSVKEIPNNLDSGMLFQNQSNTVKNEIVGVSDKHSHAVHTALSHHESLDMSELDKQLLLSQQQNFLPNIPVTSLSGTTASSATEVSQDKSMVSVSNSPVRTPADSFTLARGKLISIDSSRKGAPTALSSPISGSRSGSSKKQQILESPSSRQSPSIFGSDGSPVVEEEVVASVKNPVTLE